MFDIKKLNIWIVTYNRPECVNQTIVDLLESTPDSVPINIISNHSKLDLSKDYGLRVKTWLNNLRPDESWGYLARNWNQCFYLGLKDYEWVLCTQDDVRFRKGWVEKIQENPNYDFYTAPLFDVIFMLNREAFKEIGWFDERFLCVDMQDNDYLRRAYQNLDRKKICIEDGHGWTINGKPAGFINSIGLSEYWRHGPAEGYQPPDDRPRGSDKIHFRLNDTYRHQKWGIVGKANSQELNLKQRIPEVDWYPWFTKYIFEQTGESYPEERYLKSARKAVFTKNLKGLLKRFK